MDFFGSRVEMVENDGWAKPGWTGIVIDEDEYSVVVGWDNRKRLSHLKRNLRIILVTKGDGSNDDPNMAFKMHKYKEMNNNVKNKR